MRLWVVVLLAGCVSSVPAPTPEVPHAEQVTQVEPRLALHLRDCTEVAGISAYDMDTYQPLAPPEPWKTRDIRNDLQEPVMASAGLVTSPVLQGNITGHWHVAVSCADASWNGSSIGPLTYGWVGIAVEDPGLAAPAQHDFLMVVWSFPAGPVQKAMARDRVASVLEEVQIDRAVGARAIMDDRGNGRYQMAGDTARAGAVEPTHNRFWAMRPASGMANHHDQEGPFTPVAFLVNDTAAALAASATTNAAFAHTQTDHHAPLPGLGGNVQLRVLSGFDRTITWGPVADATFPEAWVH